MLSAARLSIASLKGNKSSSPNQDRALYLTLGRQGSTIEVLAVLDGHGEGGHEVSESCCDILPKLLLRNLARGSPNKAGPSGVAHAPMSPPDSWTHNPDEALATEWWREAGTQAFEEAHACMEALTSQTMASEERDATPGLESGGLQREGASVSYAQNLRIDARSSGTTATVVLLLPGQRLLVAHVGDSRAVFGRRRRSRDPAAPWHVVELTRDHKPDLPDERARIEETGAQVVSVGSPPNTTHRILTQNQIWPSINMSRSLGDLHAHTQGLSASAEVNFAERFWDAVVEEAVLILGSDGVWDVIDGATAVDLVYWALQQGADPAVALAQEAYERWARRGLQGGYSDDITAVVRFLC